MLVETDIHELGDKRLNPEEAVIREREDLLRNASRNKLSAQKELEDPSRSGGPRIQFSEFCSKLRRAIPEIRVVRGSPGNVALYFPRDHKEYESAAAEWEGRDRFFLTYKYVGGFAKDDIHEYSHVILDSSNLPIREVRGWRSVLLALLEQGTVSYRKLIKEFGEAHGKRAWRWAEQSRRWRAQPDSKFSAGSLDPIASIGWGSQTRS